MRRKVDYAVATTTENTDKFAGSILNQASPKHSMSPPAHTYIHLCMYMTYCKPSFHGPRGPEAVTHPHPAWSRLTCSKLSRH